MERVDGGAGMGSAAAALLGIEMRMAQQQQQIHATNAFQQPELHHQGNVAVGGGFQHQHYQQPMPVRQHAPPSYAAYAPPMPRAVKVHEEEEMGNGAVQQPGAGAAACPWSRMKWTDAMVRLLIAVVYSAGDDGEGGRAAAAAAHGKAGAAHGGHGPQAAAQQKKGKWKSVSRAMTEHGFMVSPQQCEDKFNDLNKRYKRVVDLLGRGTACKVVENPALLDAMDELTPRAKEEARKLLSSKHLYFREMCTYHNSGAAAAAAFHQMAEDGAAAACFHHPRPASSASRQAPARMNSSTRAEAEEEDDDDSEMGNDAEEEEEEDVDESDDVSIKHRGGGHAVDDSNASHNYGGRRHNNKRRGGGEDGEEDENKPPRRRARAGEDNGPSSAMQKLQSELAAAVASGDTQQLRVWMKEQAVGLERQAVAHEYRANQLDRQRVKWDRFRAQKELDMDQARLRVKLLLVDVHRMQLLLREKENDLVLAEANDPAAAGGQAPPPAASNQQQVGSSPGQPPN